MGTVDMERTLRAAAVSRGFRSYHRAAHRQREREPAFRSKRACQLDPDWAKSAALQFGSRLRQAQRARYRNLGMDGLRPTARLSPSDNQDLSIRSSQLVGGQAQPRAHPQIAREPRASGVPAMRSRWLRTPHLESIGDVAAHPDRTQSAPVRWRSLWAGGTPGRSGYARRQIPGPPTATSQNFVLAALSRSTKSSIGRLER